MLRVSKLKATWSPLYPASSRYWIPETIGQAGNGPHWTASPCLPPAALLVASWGRPSAWELFLVPVGGPNITPAFYRYPHLEVVNLLVGSRSIHVQSHASRLCSHCKGMGSNLSPNTETRLTTCQFFMTMRGPPDVNLMNHINAMSS